jgi:hypothetical protein
MDQQKFNAMMAKEYGDVVTIADVIADLTDIVDSTNRIDSGANNEYRRLWAKVVTGRLERDISALRHMDPGEFIAAQ